MSTTRARRVPCPWCKVRAGDRCVDDSTGERINGVHPERVAYYWQSSKLNQAIKG